MLQGATSSGGCWTGRRQLHAASRVPAIPDLPSEVAADPAPLCASPAYVEITLLFSSLKAD